jgi:outer membrane lipoprotein carrier protein
MRFGVWWGPEAIRAGLAGVVACACILLPGTRLDAQQDSLAVLNHAVAAYAHVTTVRGTFEQSLANPFTGTTASARGEFVQERPSRLSIRFTEPLGDRIVADGKWVWVYVPSATPGQVVRTPVTDDTGAPTGSAASVDFISQFLTNPAGRFDVSGAGTDTVVAHLTHVIVLLPHDSAQFTRAKLWVDDADGVVRQFEVTDPSGTVRHVRLLTVAFNGPVDRSSFTFRPPAGVKVVDQASMLSGSR